MDDESYQRLQDKVAEYFPDYLAFTIATQKGEVLVDDFDGHIEEVCVNDIRGFYKDRRAPPVFIHPNPLAYHYDIMVSWGELNAGVGLVDAAGCAPASWGAARTNRLRASRRFTAKPYDVSRRKSKISQPR